MKNKNTNQTVNTTPETEKRTEKKPLVIPKSAKTLIGITIALAVGAAVAAAVLIPRSIRKAEEEKAYRELINVSTDYQELLSGVDKTAVDIYKEFIIGRFIARTSDVGTKGKIKFEFCDNGVFYGHTSAYEDDCGTWELISEDDGTVALITTVPNLKERYVVDFNNNNDITLKAVDGTVMVLEPEDKILETANAPKE